MTTSPDWDAVYSVSELPPRWDTGQPQPAFVRLAESGLLTGRVLDSGCGTGEHALLAASLGADAVGIDISPRAIVRARDKAAARGLSARFEVADVVSLGQLGTTFDTVMDVGLFHVLDDEGRVRYVAGLASVLRPGGVCYLMCFSELRAGGPSRARRIRQDELRSAFTDGWMVDDITADRFELTRGRQGPSWLASIRRL
jgi:cyclopropane fatty-acyl-phospholipid synthase-like methyltransferase